MRKELCIKLTAPNQCTECGRLFGLYYIGTDRYWCVYCGSEGRIYRVVSEEGVHYEKCPNCGKKGMRDSRYVMKPLERAMSVFKVGGKICKYCGYAEYLVPKDGKAETKHTITYLERETKVWLQKQKEER